MFITFSTCFYIMPSKFGPAVYIEWMNNLISIVNHFYLVIYTDEESAYYIDTQNNPNIQVVIKPMESFHNYKYRDHWIQNHANNVLLNDRTCWQLNMLWSEKIHFVKETIERKLFDDTELYGWCDVGYFRNRFNDIHTNNLSAWCKHIDTYFHLDPTKIGYACIQNNDEYMHSLFRIVNNRNDKGLPVQPIPAHQLSIAGGFFVTHPQNIDWWFNQYDSTLRRYFEHKYLVKDDQIILADCILSNMERFTLFRENLQPFDNWFMFQRIFH